MSSFIEEVPFEIRALLGKATLSIDAYSVLEVGDVVILDQEIQAPLRILVGGEARFLGFPGLSDKNKAIKIEKEVDSP